MAATTATSGSAARFSGCRQESFKLVFNNYGVGQDNLATTPGNPLANTTRIHTDDSVELRYYNNPSAGKGLSKMAFSFTVDAGCQYGGGLHCTRRTQQGARSSAGCSTTASGSTLTGTPSQLGGGAMNNPGRYLTLLPPINGATAASGSPYFTENPGHHAYSGTRRLNFQFMPKEWITWWAEAGYRHSDVPYFAGTGGVTPPGGNNGSPQYYACNSGASAGTADPGQAAAACAGAGGVWFPDLVKTEFKLSAGIMVKF